jgi:hypothetical protein
MAISDIQICNMALSRIGVTQPIASLAEASNEARICSLWYDLCRKSILRAFQWKFARKISPLQLISLTVPGWEYVYRYPNDCINAIKVTDSGSDRVVTTAGATIYKIPFDIVADTSGAGTAIVSNQSNLCLHYTADISDTNLFDPLFTSALAWLIASEIATPLAAKADFAEAARSGYAATVHDAAASVMSEGYEGSENTTDLITARY